ncbi:sulfotransferase family protein [Pontixanthobacter aquaemixtae]|uniref:Sulfotransferase n=1 Tax=Pontixanthobacter aquaemixtae TaxID=1958940 RepID=A0A844ZQD2_9SPHN|nr:sulfotransferase [Pontixanthobacter aquaemixtae]MXO89958.1 sulfotransferase [Pontixanthobacter aquaemixtae]
MIKAEELLAAARGASGHEDLGDDSILEPFNLLVDSLNSEAGLTEMGEMIIGRTITGYLTNRLNVVDWIKQNPEILETRIEKPTFVFGLPRTGTTLTINLLNEDPARRCFLRWEAFNSVPPPKPEELHSGPRYEAAQAQIDASLKAMPHISAIHHEDGDSPSECQFSMAPSFCAQVYDSQFHMPSYHKWFLYEADYRPAFRYMKQLMQLLSSETGGHWTLKNPWHPLYLDALHETFNDAQLVMTHRDPAEVVGSACSLIWNVRKIYAAEVDREQLGRDVIETFDLMIKRQNDFRAKHGADAIYDIQYADQVGDPIGTMERLYDHFGTDLSESALAAMRGYLEAKPKDRFGKHVYSLEDYGMDKAFVRDHFAEYISDFDIQLKD